jgi:hypothetical protein
MLCLAAGAVVVPLMTDVLTLAWTHSVEKVLWEEVWRETPGGLKLEEARVRGSGAGMEPGPDARLVDGAWTWAPALRSVKELVLRRSGATADWRVCVGGRCHPIAEYLSNNPDADPVRLKPCAPARLEAALGLASHRRSKKAPPLSHKGRGRVARH